MKQMNACNGPGLWTPSVLLLDFEFIIKHSLFGYGSCVLWFRVIYLKSGFALLLLPFVTYGFMFMFSCLCPFYFRLTIISS